MSTHPSIGRLSSMVYRYTMRYLDYHLQSYGINAGQFPILTALYRNENISQEALSKQLCVDKTTLARTIKKLEREKYIVRVSKENDKRAYSICLTDKAKRIEPEIKRIAGNWTNIIIQDLSEDEKNEFFRIFEQVIANARIHIREMKHDK